MIQLAKQPAMKYPNVSCTSALLRSASCNTKGWMSLDHATAWTCAGLCMASMVAFPTRFSVTCIRYIIYIYISRKSWLPSLVGKETQGHSGKFCQSSESALHDFACRWSCAFFADRCCASRSSMSERRCLVVAAMFARWRLQGSKAPQCKLARRAVPVVLVCLQHPTVLQSTSADGGEKKMATNGYSLKKSPGIVRAGGENCWRAACWTLWMADAESISCFWGIMMRILHDWEAFLACKRVCICIALLLAFFKWRIW